MVSMHILLCFCLVNLVHLSNHVLDARLRHQFVEKRGHLVVFLADFLCLMNNFFVRFFRKTSFQQFLRADEMFIHVFVVCAMAIV